MDKILEKAGFIKSEFQDEWVKDGWTIRWDEEFVEIYENIDESTPARYACVRREDFKLNEFLFELELIS